MSKNLTEGALCRRVLTDALEERMDFAGAGRVRDEAIDDTDPERLRVRVGAMMRSLVCPRTGTLTLESVEDLDVLWRMRIIPAQNDVEVIPSSARTRWAGPSEDIHPSGLAIAAETNGISGYSSYSGIDSIDICDDEASLSVAEGVGGVFTSALRWRRPINETNICTHQGVGNGCRTALRDFCRAAALR